MKRRARIVLVVLSTLIGVGMWASLRSREPSYKGKTLTAWLKMINPSVFVSVTEYDKANANRSEVRTALVHMGTNSLPYLIKLAKAKPQDSWLKRQVNWLNEKLRFVRIPTGDQYLLTDPELAVRAFQLLGINAAPAIPELADWIAQPKFDCTPFDCLMGIGTSAIPTFVQSLATGSIESRRQSLECLASFGRAAQEAIPLATDLAQSTNEGLEYLAIEVLSELDPDGANLPLYEQKLMDTNYPTAAGYALWRIGQRGIPTLLRGLTNQCPRVRIASIAGLQPQMEEIAPGYSNTPVHQLFRLRVCQFNNNTLTTASVVYVRNESRLMVPALERVLSHPDPQTQTIAVERLKSYGLAAAGVLSVAADGTNATVRQAAATALTELGVGTSRGAINRGRISGKEIALAFTGHTRADGSEVILDALKRHNAKATFFLSGDFFRNPGFTPIVYRIISNGHFLGAASDRQIRYCETDGHTRISRNHFFADTNEHKRLREYACQRYLGDRYLETGKFPTAQEEQDLLKAKYFLPPFEAYNRDIVRWAAVIGVVLIGTTPGTLSNSDETSDGSKVASCEAIIQSIKAKEREDANGLNGAILTFHLGGGQNHSDKFHDHFGELLDYLTGKGYQLVRVDELLEAKSK